MLLGACASWTYRAQRKEARVLFAAGFVQKQQHSDVPVGKWKKKREGEKGGDFDLAVLELFGKVGSFSSCAKGKLRNVRQPDKLPPAPPTDKVGKPPSA